MWGIGIITLSAEEVRTARKNGISYGNVYNRIVQFEWSVLKAITTPVKRKVSEYYTKEDVEIAARNGISYKTFTTRVLTHRWTPERARTQPPKESGRRRKESV